MSPIVRVDETMVSVSDPVDGGGGTSEVAFVEADEFDVMAVESLLENVEILLTSLVTEEENTTPVSEVEDPVDEPPSVVET